MARRFKSNVEMENSLTLSSQTASRALTLDGSGNVVSSSVTDTELGHLSGVTSAIQTQLDDKMALISTPTQNRALTSNASGQAIETSVQIDGSGNVIIPGDLTVNGTTTTINTATLDVTDANITVNNGGNQASADSADAGITVEMSDATDAAIGYDSTLASKFAIGEVGALAEIASVSHTQTLTNKTIVAASNTITTAASGNLTSTELNAALAELQGDIDTRQPDVITTQGDLVLGDVGGDASRLAIGTSGQVLQSNGTTASWQTLPSASDELVKVSADDTTGGYLEQKIVIANGTNPTNALEASTLNPAGDEDYQIRFDESKVDHDALANFVANEHVDHSSIVLTAGNGLSGGGDITASRSFDLDFSELTAAAIASGDELAFGDIDDSNTVKKITFANLESSLNHDALSGFVANEHIDHSSVQIATAADSGLTGGGDITTTRNLSVDIAGTTEETSAADNDEILVQDTSAGALRSMSRSNFLAGLAEASAGDIAETSFSGANNQAAAANVTGLAFANVTVRSFKVHGSIVVDATADLYEEFELHGIQRGADWVMDDQRTGDDSLVTFSITNTGQVQYTSGNYAGFVSLDIKFRAITTSA